MSLLVEKLALAKSKFAKIWGESTQYDSLFASNETTSCNSCGNGRQNSNDGKGDGEDASVRDSGCDRKNCLRVSFIGIGLIAIGCLALYLCKDYLKFLLLWMENIDLRIAAVIFIALFIAVSFPMMWGYILLNVAAGYLYGLLFGTLLTCGCALLGIFLAHEVTRRCFSEYVMSKLSSNEGLLALLRVVESKRGFKVVILARLTPIPFGLQNGLFAISNIGCLRYLVASTIGLMPTQILNAYIGTTLRSMEEVLTDSSNTITAYVVFFSQLLLTAALTTYIVRRAKIELGKAMKEHSEVPAKHDANMNGQTVIIPMNTQKSCDTTSSSNGIVVNGGFYTTKIEVVNDNTAVHARVPSR